MNSKKLTNTNTKKRYATSKSIISKGVASKKSAKKRLVLFVIIVGLMVGLSGYIWKRNRNIDAKAESTCSYTDNRRLLCYAKELAGYPYGSPVPAGYWSNYWGRPIAGNASLGYKPAKWYNMERFNPNRNFIGCSGFVNVVFYLANNKEPIFTTTNSQRYINDSRFKVISGRKWYNKLKPGDLVIKKVDGKIQGHVAIVEKVQNGKLYTYEAAASNQQVDPRKPYSGRRVRRITSKFIYAYGLRWTKEFPAPLANTAVEALATPAAPTDTSSSTSSTTPSDLAAPDTPPTPTDTSTSRMSSYSISSRSIYDDGEDIDVSTIEPGTEPANL